MKILHEKSYGVDRLDKMSDSNDTLLDIYKFSSDIVRCPTIILSLEVSYKCLPYRTAIL